MNHKTRLALGMGVCVVGTACSASPTSPEGVAPAADPAATHSAPAASEPLVYFEGSVDTVAGTMQVVTRSATGRFQTETTLPYGDATGSVYFHTCSSGLVGSIYSGGVTAINQMSGTVTALNAVIDAISGTTVTLASGSGAGNSSGIIASYGTVAQTGSTQLQNCTTPTTWSFNDPGGTSFNFVGHADGTPPVTVHTFQFTDTAAIDLARSSLQTFFQSFTATSTDFMLQRLADAGGARNTAICTARADWYVSEYLSTYSGGGNAASGSWNKYGSSSLGVWQAVTTASFTNYFANDGPGSVIFDYGLGSSVQIRLLPGNTGSSCASGIETYDGYNGGCTAPGAVYTLSIGPDRLSTCGF